MLTEQWRIGYVMDHMFRVLDDEAVISLEKMTPLAGHATLALDHPDKVRLICRCFHSLRVFNCAPKCPHFLTGSLLKLDRSSLPLLRREGC